MNEDWQFETAAVHSALPRGLGEPVGVPIYAAATFQFEGLEDARDEFALNTGRSYSRLQNPSAQRLETRLTMLEGGSHTVVLASGQAATLATVLAVCRAGDHVVATAQLFGGSAALLGQVLPLMGIQTSFVENEPQAVQRALQPNTRLVWTETLSNPAGYVPDLAALAELAHAHGALLAVDNTCGGAGFLCRPLEHGADLVAQSLTKWAAGHGAVLGGSVTTRLGVKLERNPLFTELLAQKGEQALPWRLRWLATGQLGMILPPHSAFLVLQGLETLALRLRQECHNALALAKWLQQRAEVKGVSYPGLDDHPTHLQAQRYLTQGFGALLTFEAPDPSRFLARLRLIRLAPNLGDVRTLVIHPWTTTHSKVPEDARYAAGVTPHTIRMSVGIEALTDLQADLAQALEEDVG